ncbi:R-spondin-4 [Hippocampus comes]|uniref:R-spondin 4 n=1 Tax=Hippocampus comes TaxID=109280 RepID=A0A3Q2YX49_HIPCM|nr:PREDICTED: R-spondin-2-like [Hippocampus comes]
MRLPLVAIAMSLLCDAIRSQSRWDAERDRSGSCANCKECSHDNGCVRCAERLFLLLRRRGVSQHGSCLTTCPEGYFGQRGAHLNRCLKCRPANCERCFGRDFCTRCKSGFRLYNGRCVNDCPAGTVKNDAQCLDDCTLVPLTEWSAWSVCLRNGAPCGLRLGQQTRTRESVAPDLTPSPDRTACPSRSQTRSCRMSAACPTDSRRPRTRGRGRKRKPKPLWMLANSKASDARNVF